VWTRRWLLIRLSLAWIAGLVTWIVVFGPDDRVRETASYALLGLGGVIVTSYCGFATWDDRNFLHFLRDRNAPSGTPSEPEGAP
jgi:hypothetical protein